MYGYENNKAMCRNTKLRPTALSREPEMKTNRIHWIEKMLLEIQWNKGWELQKWLRC